MKLLIIVLSVLMSWTFTGQGVQGSNGFFGGLQRKFEEEKSYIGETVEKFAQKTRSAIRDLVKPNNQCGCPPMNSSQPIIAADFNISSADVTDTGCGFPVVRLRDGQWVGYLSIDFGLGAKVVTTRIANGSPEATEHEFTAYFYLDQPYGNPFALVSVLPVRGWCGFVELKTYVKHIPRGVRNVFIVGSSDPRPEFAVFNLEWFRFDAQY